MIMFRSGNNNVISLCDFIIKKMKLEIFFLILDLIKYWNIIDFKDF